MVLARPVLPDQFDRARVGLVQGCIIDDQEAGIQPNMGRGLVPQAIGVGIKPMEQAGECIMCRCTSTIWLHAARLQTTIRFGCSDQEVDIVEFVGFRMVHNRSVAHSALTA